MSLVARAFFRFMLWQLFVRPAELTRRRGPQIDFFLAVPSQHQLLASKAPPLHSRFILAIRFDIKMSCMGSEYTLNVTSSAIDFELQMSM